MKRTLLLVSLVLSVILLAITLAEANHVMYVPGNNIYNDAGLITCSTKEESLTVLRSMAKETYLTFATAREIAETNNCVFHRDPVLFTISDIICQNMGAEKKIFSIAKATIKNGQERFTILYTDSKTPVCEK